MQEADELRRILGLLHEVEHRQEDLVRVTMVYDALRESLVQRDEVPEEHQGLLVEAYRADGVRQIGLIRLVHSTEQAHEAAKYEVDLGVLGYVLKHVPKDVPHLLFLLWLAVCVWDEHWRGVEDHRQVAVMHLEPPVPLVDALHRGAPEQCAAGIPVFQLLAKAVPNAVTLRLEQTVVRHVRPLFAQRRFTASGLGIEVHDHTQHLQGYIHQVLVVAVGHISTVGDAPTDWVVGEHHGHEAAKKVRGMRHVAAREPQEPYRRSLLVLLRGLEEGP
mmetsp:Transcript_69969/g.149789  ORF Transcript_69969/g.149789 Transcript_69969/m.149789 type:complete len:275 (-) Transcript_69969:96-920(-)